MSTLFGSIKYILYICGVLNNTRGSEPETTHFLNAYN